MRKLLFEVGVVFGVLLAWRVAADSGASAPLLEAPAGRRPVAIVRTGETILPNGRLITPLGKHVNVAPHPYGLTLSPDGKTLVTANSGTNPFSVSIITDLAGPRPRVVQIPPGYKLPDADPESVYAGVAVGPDNRTLYFSEGNNGNVGVFDTVSHQRLDWVSLDGFCEGEKYKSSLTGELELSPDGRRLYVLDLGHFRLVAIDTASKQILFTLPVGRLPFGLAVSPDGGRVYVSNVGMFRYSIIPGYDSHNTRRTGLDFPAFGFPSKEAEEGVTIDGRTIPGLGDPNSLESNSVWVIDVSNPGEPRVAAKVRTGLPVGEQSVGGSSPGAVVAGRDKVYVSNASQDSISIIGAQSFEVEKTVVLEPAASVRGLRGVLPFGMALSPDEKRLYVACAGINALAVLDAQRGTVLGYLPTAWFPARLAISRDGRTLYVANAKGFGAGPNGGPNFHPGPEGTYIGDITKGVVSILPVPPDAILGRLTEQVVKNNGFIPSTVPAQAGAAAPRSEDASIPPPGQVSARIKHVVFIVKENRTFDQVFGDLESIGGERVAADPELARFGGDAEVSPQARETLPRLQHVRVTPNHHALARRFCFSDNYYVDSDVSADGHLWLVGNYPNEVMESLWPAHYGHQLDFKLDPTAPGRLEVGGDLWPETYQQAGALWHHLARHQISFRNYGENLELPGVEDGVGLQPTGVRQSLNVPLPEPLFENTSRAYPTFNTSISDQYRFAQFQNEFLVRYLSGKMELPQLLYIWLPNDHTANPRPADGYPYRASYVGDNDLALGKLIELFSHSPFWKDMAIFVTEDDAQSGLDHVDAHRSLLLVISPYARRGVSHVHTSMASIMKTIDLIFGLPYLNQYDAAATDLADCFTSKPDLAPFDALPSDTRIFDPAKVVEPGLEMRAQPRAPSERLDDPASIRRLLREESRE